MTKLDKTDLMILQALQNDAKTSMKTLADALHLSKTPVYERIRRLEKEGIIKRYVALVDPEKIGLPLVVFCNVSLAIHDEEHIRQFRETIGTIDEITECYTIGGIHDFFLKVVVKDLQAYDRGIRTGKTHQNPGHRENAELLRPERNQAYDRPETG